MSFIYRYKNTSSEDISMVGVGAVEAGKTFTSDFEIENPNLELVDKKRVTAEKAEKEADVTGD